MIIFELLAYSYVVIELFITILLIIVMLDGKACQVDSIVNICTHEHVLLCLKGERLAFICCDCMLMMLHILLCQRSSNVC